MMLHGGHSSLSQDPCSQVLPADHLKILQARKWQDHYWKADYALKASQDELLEFISSALWQSSAGCSAVMSVLTLKNELAKVVRFAVEQDQDIWTEISAQTVKLSLLTMLNGNHFILCDFWDVLWPRKDAVRRRRQNDPFFFYQTQATVLLWAMFGVRWVPRAQSAPEGRCAAGTSGAEGGCPWEHPACAGWQSAQPVSTHWVGMSYPSGNNPFGSGTSYVFPAHPPPPQQFPQPGSTCSPIPACPGALTAPSPSQGEPGAGGSRAAHSCPALCFPWWALLTSPWLIVFEFDPGVSWDVCTRGAT